MVRSRGRGYSRGGRGGGRRGGDGPLTSQSSSAAPTQTSAPLQTPVPPLLHINETVDLAAATPRTAPPAIAEHGGPSSYHGSATSTSNASVPSAVTDLAFTHVEHNRLKPQNPCSHAMRLIFWQRLHPKGYIWKNVSTEYKEGYFEEFKVKTWGFCLDWCAISSHRGLFSWLVLLLVSLVMGFFGLLSPRLCFPCLIGW